MRGSSEVVGFGHGDMMSSVILSGRNPDVLTDGCVGHLSY